MDQFSVTEGCNGFPRRARARCVQSRPTTRQPSPLLSRGNCRNRVGGGHSVALQRRRRRRCSVADDVTRSSRRARRLRPTHSTTSRATRRASGVWRPPPVETVDDQGVSPSPQAVRGGVPVGGSVPSLRLTNDQDYDYFPNITFRGPTRLEVAWDSDLDAVM